MQFLRSACRSNYSIQFCYIDVQLCRDICGTTETASPLPASIAISGAANKIIFVVTLLAIFLLSGTSFVNCVGLPSMQRRHWRCTTATSTAQNVVLRYAFELMPAKDLKLLLLNAEQSFTCSYLSLQNSFLFVFFSFAFKA